MQHQLISLLTVGLLVAACLLPVAPVEALSCYNCVGCSTVSGLTPTSSSLWTHCTKTDLLGVITRTGSNACVATSNTWCCNTDNCNSAGLFGPSGALMTAALAVLAALFKQ